MCDPAEENCDKGVSGLGNVELDIQAVHNIRCVCVCVCVCVRCMERENMK